MPSTRRLLLCALAALLVLPATASAHRIVARGSVSGTVTAVSASSFTIETPGKWGGVVDTLVSAATKVTRRAYPYVYGGGHARASVASVGAPGPGYNGHRKGFDCSGSVAAVLSAAGLWPAGSGVPNDLWVIKELRQQGLIAPGPGKGPIDVMLYDDPNVHIFMSIDGAYFGTSDGGGGGNRRGGAGWLDDGAPYAWSPATYKRYHFLPSALTGSAGAGHKITFQLSALPTPPALGAHVRVTYVEAASGSIVATATG